MLRVLIACTGFKDVLQAQCVCDCLQTALSSLDPCLQISSLPLSDGGEGFLSSLSSSFPPEAFLLKELEVTGPLGLPIIGHYGILSSNSKKIGVVELARVSGIEFVENSLRNPYNTTSHGTGEAIRHIYDEGIREIYVGLGGSATTDGGLSVLYALQALDFEFTGPTPRYITGSNLKSIKSVRTNGSKLLSELKIHIACDVNNPMLGLRGSARVFGPQKGISDAMMEEYESLMMRVNEILEGIKGRSVGNHEFTGAAGGISGGLMACFDNLTIQKGIDIISSAVDLERKILESNLVITGEGCFDQQTSGGKVVSKILQLCPSAIIVCGLNRTSNTERIYDLNSRFGNQSISAVQECLAKVAEEIYINEIRGLISEIL